MLKLKSIELTGFKSFSDRTRLEFPTGITAVVGPNGCGKSNLADAIHWVLGEQSARTLRGGRMADVIFNGTRHLPPTGLAEVHLTLVDPEGRSPEILFPLVGRSKSLQRRRKKRPQPDHAASPVPEISGSEASQSSEALTEPSSIVVSRRLFRSGDSEYLINGEKCRLRDIQGLFRDLGLGPDSYAIIEQGRIGQILSSKPSDRRAILEEAAGVSNFRTQKRLSELKLESSRSNLARVHDILEEVSRQVNSLKRQAGKARRFRELKNELSHQTKLTLVSRWAALQKESEKIGQELVGLEQQIASLAQRLTSEESEQKAIRDRNFELESQRTSLRAELAEAEIERERALARLERVAHEMRNLAQKTQEASSESHSLDEQIGSLDATVESKKQKLAQFEEERARAQSAARDIENQNARLAEQISEEESRDESGRQALLDAVGQGIELKNRSLRYDESFQDVNRRIARLQSERGALEKTLSGLKIENDKLSADERKCANELEQSERIWKENRRSLEKARQAESESRRVFENWKDSLAKDHARARAVEESLERHTYAPENVHHLLAGDSSRNGGHFRSLGVLADFIEVRPGYEALVEEYLKGELDSMVVEDYEDARSGIKILSEENRGRSAFFVRGGSTNGHSAADDAENRTEGSFQRGNNGARVVPLSDLVHFQEQLGAEGRIVLHAVQNAFVVSQSKAAQELALEFPTQHFLTPAGEHYHHRLVRGGKGPSSGPLALRRELRQISQRVEDWERKTQHAKKTKEAAELRVVELEQEGEQLLARRQRAEPRVFAITQKRESLQKDLRQNDQRRKIIEQEIRQLQNEQTSLRQQQAEARREWETATRKEHHFQDTLERARGSLRKMRVQQEQMRGPLLESQAEARALEERIQFTHQELEELAARLRDKHRHREELLSDLHSWQEQTARLQQEEQQERQNLQERESQRRRKAELLGEKEHESDRLRNRTAELEPKITETREEQGRLRQQQSQLKVFLARTESERDHPFRLCQEEFGASPEELRKELGMLLEADAVASAEQECRQLKNRLEAFGAVNMVALEELTGAEERKMFLGAQESDLLASIEDTSAAIRELEKISRQKFAEAFQVINDYFDETFRILFGGGVGEMRLSSEDDPDGGLDIIAQPPGKRLQNVLLLSGGEKAMTALALLIAIFRYRPSPFCLLDEVDAPLDESNVGRFTRLVHQLSSHTQFILITHNKKTMETAEYLYGVTMEEPGVSRLASVHLERNSEPMLTPNPRNTRVALAAHSA